jgi:hypothetical protein
LGFLHEPAKIPDRERKLEPSVEQVTESTDDVAVLRWHSPLLLH